MKNDIVVGLDVGTTKVCAVVAERGDIGPRVLGTGTAPSAGIRKGIVIGIDAAVDSIKRAVRDAEVSSGVKIRCVSLAMSGGHIRGFNSSGAIGIRGKEVDRADISHVVDTAKAVYIPLDREVIHVIPTEFVLDGQDGIANPMGMSGVRLEARVHIITGGASPIQNLAKCCEKAGLDVSDIVFGPIASARSTLTKDEREFGVVLIDIGGGTTDIALFRDGKVRHAAVVGAGGAHITNDIAVGLRVGTPEAERLKKEYGAAFESMVPSSEEMIVAQAGGQSRTLPRKYIAELIQPRCEEILELIKTEITHCAGYETAVCGVVLTGGSSLLAGFDRMAESVLGLPVRTGFPWKITGLQSEEGSISYATGVGLVAYEDAPEALEEAHAGLVTGVFEGLRAQAGQLLKFVEIINSNFKKEGGMVCLKSKK